MIGAVVAAAAVNGCCFGGLPAAALSAVGPAPLLLQEEGVALEREIKEMKRRLGVLLHFTCLETMLDSWDLFVLQ